MNKIIRVALGLIIATLFPAFAQGQEELDLQDFHYQWVPAPRPEAMPDATALAQAAAELVAICPDRIVVCEGQASGGSETWLEGDTKLKRLRTEACVAAVAAAGGTPETIQSGSLWGPGNASGRGVALWCGDRPYPGSIARQATQVSPPPDNDASALRPRIQGPPGPQSMDGQAQAFPEWLHIILRPEAAQRRERWGFTVQGGLAVDFKNVGAEVAIGVGLREFPWRDNYFRNGLTYNVSGDIVVRAGPVDFGPWFQFEEMPGYVASGDDLSEYHAYRPGAILVGRLPKGVRLGAIGFFEAGVDKLVGYRPGGGFAVSVGADVGPIRLEFRGLFSWGDSPMAGD